MSVFVPVVLPKSSHEVKMARQNNRMIKIIEIIILLQKKDEVFFIKCFFIITIILL